MNMDQKNNMKCGNKKKRGDDIERYGNNKGE